MTRLRRHAGSTPIRPMAGWLSGRLLLILVAVGGGLIGGCDGAKVSKTPAFAQTPQTFLFPKLAPGEKQTRTVELRNTGPVPLLINRIELDDRSSAQEYSLMLMLDGELVAVPEQLELPPDDEGRATLAVIYAPTDQRSDGGSTVTMATNDGDNLVVRIPIITDEGGAQILVSPRSIDFGEVVSNETADEQLTITNVGVGDLIISRLNVSGSPDFTVRDGERILDGNLEPPLVIPACLSVEGCDGEDARTLTVRYAPQTQGGDIGKLEIGTNADGQAITTVDLRANGAAPCILLVPADTVDFGSALIVPSDDVETPNTRDLLVRSCGDVPLRVSALEIEGGDGRFRLMDLPDANDDGDVIVLPGATNGADLPEVSVQVGFWPLRRQASGARVKVFSNASAEPATVELFGRGTDNACPIPAVAQAEYSVQPLDTIVLDGSPSLDPGGEVKEWSWTVVDRPMGSVAQPVETFTDITAPAAGGEPDDIATPTALFFVDLAGHYEIELQVRDNLDQLSCPPEPVARLVIDAVPQKDLHIQLVWSTLNDPDETDAFGTDVDLHFRHQSGAPGWNDDAQGFDCFFGNPTPDWGVQGVLTDNPTIDIDDTNGAGPENINLSNPEAGVIYDIGALYFRSESTFGLDDVDVREEHPSYVSVRVFVRGELLVEFIDRELDAAQQLWWVTSIEWCEDAAVCPRVEFRDEVLEPADYILE